FRIDSGVKLFLLLRGGPTYTLFPPASLRPPHAKEGVRTHVGSARKGRAGGRASLPASVVRPAPGGPPPHAVGRTPRDSAVEMLEIVLPNDANVLGAVLGGKVMHLMDLAAAMAAQRHARRPAVTAMVDELTFLHPIRIGEHMILK